MRDMSARPLVELTQIEKSFGAVRALAGVTLEVGRGQCLGVVGHNGAGKSTLMAILRGTLPCSSGSIRIDGEDVTGAYSVRRAYELGVRCVFQEPSLCMTLRVYENVRLLHRRLRGPGWAARARRMISDSLDAIFPGHGVHVDAMTGDLVAAQRQMVEIARAFTVVATPVRLVILDEPTSALDSSRTEQFLGYIRRAAETGISTILISHRLKEIVSTTSRVVIMRDGRIVGTDDTAALDEESIVERMGVMGQMEERDAGHAGLRPGAVAHAPAAGDGPLRIEAGAAMAGALHLSARAGEVIGLAGLDAHGQREMLLKAYVGDSDSGGTMKVVGRTAYVSGDRFREGVFPLWTVGQNLTVSVLRQMANWGLISPKDEDALAEKWRVALGIKTPNVRFPIVSLSGGNQQKVLIARALCSGADIILLDDPMRGVDVASKREMFEQIRREAAAGKCFLLYTTEFEELNYCDRTYVFYRNQITDEILRGELSEERVLRSSFTDAAAGGSMEAGQVAGR